ncbi:hypothetical protein [Sphingomonas sp. 37zxx]|uniref:hypothetical protein n=1 Tax=Sphingomonas sp. 37zxx TaxID=1550073 RepID=UPI000AA15C52|nr:hypothetical protein [Sphingomonas sp. 37zxx]
MNFSILTDILTMIFCSAVLVQSVRLMRYLRAMKETDLASMVAALDTATGEAKAVLADLQRTLRVDCAANARAIATGTAMREELTVMAGIADAVAERIVEAVEQTKQCPAPLPKSAAKAEGKTEVKVAAKPKAEPVSQAKPEPASEPSPSPAPKLAPAPKPTPMPVAAKRIPRVQRETLATKRLAARSLVEGTPA